ncbi:PAS domain S-box protein [Salegentibacter chungangensis]|uniref:histidine kinase n=1 Tax=Salegentibacter chungangensis TaxID=1335724 RepID=A0ABW3NTJ9_9FLAO
MPRNSDKLKILVFEDNPGDFVLIQEYLDDEFTEPFTEWAKTYKQGKDIIESNGNFNAILLDLSLPDVTDNHKLVKDILNLAGDIPVIVLTGFANRKFGIETLSQGVSDYLLKDELNSSVLSKSIDYSIERKKVQLELKESEEKYRTLFESSPLPMWVLDRYTLEFLSVNQAAINLYGYTREEFHKMTVKDLWVEGIAGDIEPVVEKNFHDFFEIKVKHNKKSGELLYVEVQSNPIIFAGKEARVTLAHDVTAKVKAEEELLHSEQRFKSLVQDGSDITAIINEEYAYTYVSPNVTSILGHQPEEMLGNKFVDYIHPDDLEKIMDNESLLSDRKRVQIPSFRFMDAKGNWRWLETIVTNLLDEKAVGGIVTNSRDISEFIAQEQELVNSLKRYDIVAKATSDLITDYNVKEDVISYNDAIYDMFGYSEEEIGKKGAWWDDKIHPEDYAQVKAKVAEMYEKGKRTLKTEYRFRCADGSFKYILDRSYLIIDSEGEPVRVIGSMQNITERINYINTIEERNKRLQEIAWTQSHVVRAPLARIMGLADLLKNSEEDEGNRELLLENILTSAEELDEIIRRIANITEEQKNL